MNINKKTILAWDIETAPLPDFNEEHPAWDTWANRNRNEKLDSQGLIDLFNTTAGLYSPYSQIVCLSYGYFHEGKVVLKSLVGTEKEIIEGFILVCEKFVASRGGVQFLGHNIIDFDCAFFCQAYSKYFPLFSLPSYLFMYGVKPWDINHYDTLKIFKGSAFRFSSMAEVAFSLGLPSPKADTDGSKVAELFRNGEIERISKYCQGDVLTSINILLKWNGEAIAEIFSSENTTKETVVETPNIEDEKPFLYKKLINTGKLTAAEKKKLNAEFDEIEDQRQVLILKSTVSSLYPSFVW